MFADREKDEAVGRRRVSAADAGYDRASLIAPARTLRYTTSPLGQRVADRPSAGGITAAENAAVHNLSRGRVDLHAIGASVHHVAETHPRLTAVGARSLTQGRQALIGDPADRGHEIWHLAQQAMGRIRPTTTVAGAPVNADARLEADADRMGAVITRVSDPGQPYALTASTTLGIASDAPIQRQVKKFKSTKEMREPPVPDLLSTIDYSKFQDDEDDVEERILDRMFNPKKTKTPLPKTIEATIAPNTKSQNKLKRAGHKSSVVGKIGADNFFLRSGTRDVFEGGHLIPHELWTSSDPQSNLADDYVNLIPMSRNMNVGEALHTWRNTEKQMIDHWNAGNTFTVSIKIDNPVSQDYSYGRMSEIFGLNLADDDYETDTFKLWSWLPAAVNITDAKNVLAFNQAFENERFNIHRAITTFDELVTELKRTAIWDRCDEDLQSDLLEM